jgi:hypothetical protein
MPGERVARLTIAVTSIQDVLARAKALIALRVLMRRGLPVARWTAAQAPCLVLTAVARSRFARELIGAASASAARRIRMTLVVARVEIARIEVHGRATFLRMGICARGVLPELILLPDAVISGQDS